MAILGTFAEVSDISIAWRILTKVQALNTIGKVVPIFEEKRVHHSWKQQILFNRRSCTFFVSVYPERNKIVLLLKRELGSYLPPASTKSSRESRILSR
jgi:hypothetical protein